MNFIFWGGAGSLSFRVLSALLESGLKPKQVNIGIAKPAGVDSKRLLMLQPARNMRIAELAGRHAIPVNTISRQQNNSAGLAQANANTNDHTNAHTNANKNMSLLACYPFRLPPAIFAHSGSLFLNLHPSFLPANRGPEPVFWQLKSGMNKIGVTIHKLAENFDTGDVMTQSFVSTQDFPDAVEIEQRIAKRGAELFALLSDNLKSGKELPATPQIEAAASYQPMPTPFDYRLDSTQPVAQVFRFVTGVCHSDARSDARSGIRFFVTTSAGEKRMGRALDWSGIETTNTTNVQLPDENKIHFADGWIQFAPAPCAPL